jgi:hypothetical protein
VKQLREMLLPEAARTATAAASTTGAQYLPERLQFTLCKALPFEQKLESFAHLLKGRCESDLGFRLSAAIVGDVAEELSLLVRKDAEAISPKALLRMRALGELLIRPENSRAQTFAAHLVGQLDGLLHDAKVAWPFKTAITAARKDLDAFRLRGLDAEGLAQAEAAAKDAREGTHAFRRVDVGSSWRQTRAEQVIDSDHLRSYSGVQRAFDGVRKSGKPE